MLIGAVIVLLVGAMILIAEGNGLIADPDATATQFDDWEGRIMILSISSTVALLSAGAALIAWLARVVDNIPRLTGEEPSFSPRAAILWWFVPIANLFRPAEIVEDAYSRLGTSEAHRSAAVVWIWWWVWIFATISERGVERLFEVATAEDYFRYTAIAVAILSAQILAGLLLLRIIWEIERRVQVRAMLLSVPSTVLTGEQPSLAAITPSSRDHWLNIASHSRPVVGQRVRVAYRDTSSHSGVRGVVTAVEDDAVVVRSAKSGSDVRVPVENIKDLVPLDRWTSLLRCGLLGALVSLIVAAAAAFVGVPQQVTGVLGLVVGSYAAGKWFGARGGSQWAIAAAMTFAVLLAISVISIVALIVLGVQVQRVLT